MEHAVNNNKKSSSSYIKHEWFKFQVYNLEQCKDTGNGCIEIVHVIKIKIFCIIV
jgi:hypothetical protein